ncbi:MAG: SDR family oxidoreductase [Arenicellales bacterium]|jgi:NAD(P)-dependent dehydrogenase (short-subunit alcohol dehydrogenase family)|nr:SDR family oxidoreductase [Arenicellales bacterium]
MELNGKVCIITGGSEGIGKATALLLAAKGARVTITGRTKTKLEAVVAEGAEQGLSLDYFVGDVSNETDCAALVKHVVETHQRVDILFNNAGILHGGMTHETSTEVWDAIFNTNVRGTFFMSRQVLPHMVERGEGCIVNNSSIAGLKAVPGLAAYNASKGAITQLTKSMALEYADQGIRINAVCPGTCETPLIDKSRAEMVGAGLDEETIAGVTQRFINYHPMGRFGKPEEIAHAVLFLCSSENTFMTGTMLSVDGGFCAT